MCEIYIPIANEDLNEYIRKLERTRDWLREIKELPTHSPLGSSWQDARKEIFTPEENKASDLRVKQILDSLKKKTETNETSR